MIVEQFSKENKRSLRRCQWIRGAQI